MFRIGKMSLVMCCHVNLQYPHIYYRKAQNVEIMISYIVVVGDDVGVDVGEAAEVVDNGVEDDEAAEGPAVVVVTKPAAPPVVPEAAAVVGSLDPTQSSVTSVHGHLHWNTQIDTVH